MPVIQTVPGETTLGYAIVNSRSFYVAAETSPHGLVLWRGLVEAKLYDSRVVAYRALLKRWKNTYTLIEVEVVRITRCAVCDGRGHGCVRCRNTGREVQR